MIAHYNAWPCNGSVAYATHKYDKPPSQPIGVPSLKLSKLNYITSDLNKMIPTINVQQSNSRSKTG